MSQDNLATDQSSDACHECGAVPHEPWCSAHESVAAARFYCVRPVDSAWEAGYYSADGLWVWQGSFSHEDDANAYADDMNRSHPRTDLPIERSNTCQK